MDRAKLRAWYAHRQGLLGELEGQSPESVFEQIGWARSVGGANPYLTLFSRAGASREDADRAAEELSLSELPSARSCTYVVARSDFELALVVARRLQNSTEWTTAKKLGVTAEEIEHLEKRIVEALESGADDPAGIKKKVGDASRSLGDEGKKKGLTTTLPLAIAELQVKGKIVRRPVNGRFDSQRYAYALWKNGPLEEPSLTPEQAHALLARRYFKWNGPATLKQFGNFAALSQKGVREATESLGLVSAWEDSEQLLLPEDLAAFHAFQIPGEPVYRLIGGLANLVLARQDISTFADEDDMRRPLMQGSGGFYQPSRDEMSLNLMIDRGRIVGVWEYDLATSSIVWNSFIDPDDALRKAIADMEAFARHQLGDVRSFSLDSPESRKPKIEALRAASWA
ncbi:MAG TPA: crosslink repair DNA glycosylase YcaQ family protein [Fimbriimonas sp.]|nr:crosslink repair DNA glycosylase YcaQ family protein [Fimbriimonas sp.]